MGHAWGQIQTICNNHIRSAHHTHKYSFITILRRMSSRKTKDNAYHNSQA